MKTLIAMLLICAALVATAPNASASCVVQDPIALTHTCIGHTDEGWGDEECAEAPSYHHQTTFVATGVPGVVFVGVSAFETCSNSFWGTWSGSGVTFYTDAQDVATVGAGTDHYESEDLGEECRTYVYADSAATGQHGSESDECPPGV